MAAKLEDLARHRKSRQDGSKRPESEAKRRSGRGCPICGAPQVERFRPFCSGRCADIDLGHWLNESYRVPAEESPEMEPESKKTEAD